MISLASANRSLDDWFSPILVKELRQGMRGKAFVISFLLLQVFLVMLVLGNVAAEQNRSALNDQASFFWIIIGVALLGLMPLRGLSAISQEVKRNTMETVLLTRLTPWRVVFGKWSALFAQSVLFVVAVLPYVVLRYFIGGTDVVGDFLQLCFFLWLSGMLLAAAIAASAMLNLVIRVIVVLALLFFGGNADDFLSASSLPVEVWKTVAWLVLLGFFGIALLFELAASSIAAPSENHALRRRLLALSFFILSLLLAWLTDATAGFMGALPLMVLIAVCYYELSEKARLVPRLVLSASRFGWLGRMASGFFLPGWSSALLFSILALPFATMIYALMNPNSGGPLGVLSLPFLICAVLGSALAPILICHLIWKSMKQVFLMVVLYNIAIMGVASLLQGFAELTQTKINYLIALFPSIPVLYSLRDTGLAEFLPSCLIVNVAVVICQIFILFVASRPYFRGLRELFRQARVDAPTPAA